LPGYGVSNKRDGMLKWSYLSKQMAQMRNYWIATTRPDGRPHAAPVWGVWLDETFYFSTGRKSVKARNLAHNPSLVVHLESGDDVVILEGTAEAVSDPAILSRFNQAYGAKYKFYPLGKDGKRQSRDPIFALRLRVAFGWLERKFLSTPTRWIFEK
jgi:PPOX class probable F420-dependent enzyme